MGKGEPPKSRSYKRHGRDAYRQERQAARVAWHEKNAVGDPVARIKYLHAQFKLKKKYPEIDWGKPRRDRIAAAIQHKRGYAAANSYRESCAV
jgi:hypothetical protein